MMSVTSRNFIFLVVVCSVSVQSEVKVSPITKTVEEVDRIFKEIEEDHNILKSVFKEVLTKEVLTKEAPPCKCVPFYLCNIEEGRIIDDGEGILTSRVSPDCENSQDVCCMQPSISTRSMKIETNEQKGCGYGMRAVEPSTDNNQPFAGYAEFPWTIMIANYQPQNRRAEYKCVGSLIHPQVVVTAAHCVERTDAVIVRAGEWNRKKTNENKSHQDQVVKSIIKHPKFKLANLRYDVALLITKEPFDMDENINTACLSSSIPTSSESVSSECITTGWGVDTPEGSYSDIMRKIKFLLMPSDHCETTFKSTRLGQWFKLHSSFVCAVNQYASDACEGNGGAPLVCPIDDQPERYQQVGVTAWGIDCASNKPSVFTNVPEIKTWIDQQFDELGFSKEFYTLEQGNAKNP